MAVLGSERSRNDHFLGVHGRQRLLAEVCNFEIHDVLEHNTVDQHRCFPAAGERLDITVQTKTAQHRLDRPRRHRRAFSGHKPGTSSVQT